MIRFKPRIVCNKVRKRPMDPTRTHALRSHMLKEINRRFSALKLRIRKLIVDEDVFGLAAKPIVNVSLRDNPFTLSWAERNGITENRFCPGSNTDSSCGADSKRIEVEHVDQNNDALRWKAKVRVHTDPDREWIDERLDTKGTGDTHPNDALYALYSDGHMYMWDAPKGANVYHNKVAEALGLSKARDDHYIVRRIAGVPRFEGYGRNTWDGEEWIAAHGMSYNESYFGVCERDTRGRCVARGIEIEARDAAELDARLKEFGKTREQVAASAGAMPGANVVMYVGASSGMINVEINHPLYFAHRLVDRDEIRNELIEMKHQDKGMGTEVFARQVEAAASNGYRRLTCEAARYDSDVSPKNNMNGYYTWPRLGYTGMVEGPQTRSVPGIPLPAREHMNVKLVMATPEGRRWWKENGETFEAEFDLTEGSYSRRTLDAYRQERAATGRAPGRGEPPSAGRGAVGGADAGGAGGGTANRFCPTGPGGGVDPTCGKGDGTKEHPYKCGADIELAARLIAEGEHVELAQPDQVATLLHKLQKYVKAGKSIDLCNVSVPHTNLFCQDNLGIPRVKMPQLRGFAAPGTYAATLKPGKSGQVDVSAEFIDHLREQGIKSEETTVRASHLRATQDQLSAADALSQMDKGIDRLREKRIFVTRDNYILDGHHRWAGTVALGYEDGKDFKIPVHRLDTDIGTALRLANEFTANVGVQRQAHNAFCPTGPGGGIDPTCHPPRLSKSPKAMEKAVKEIIAKGDFVAFQGTSEAAWEHIRKEGLVAGRGHGATEGNVMLSGVGPDDAVDRARYVYLTDSIQTAQMFANLAEHATKTKGVIVAVDVPPTEKGKFSVDPVSAPELRAYRYDGAIPPAWIKAAITHNTATRFYAVVMCTEPVDNSLALDAAAFAADRNPSEGRKRAGNYRKGHVKVHGLDVTIETPMGALRHDHAAQHHYGYIRRTIGADGDQVDCFLGPHPTSPRVFVVDQVDSEGQFDEHKVMLGFLNEAQADAAYRANYPHGWNVGKMTEMDVAAFKRWLKTPAMSPLANVFCATGEGGGVDASCRAGGVRVSLDSGGVYVAEFVVGKQQYLFSVRSIDGVPNVGFSTWDEDKGAGYKLTGKNVAVEVLAKVNVALKGYLEAKAPTKFTFTADHSEPSRVKAYDNFAPCVGKRYGYKVFVSELGGEHPSRLYSFERNTTHNRLDYAFHTNRQQVEAFQRWLKAHTDSYIDDRKLWSDYVQQGYRKGAGRAFDDVKAAKKIAMDPDVYDGTRDDFLKTSFGHPETVEKVQLLVGRTFDELDGVSSDMSLRMGRALADGLVEGRSPVDIAGDMADEVDIGRTRAERIARTEIIRAHAEGQLDAMEDMGVGEVGVEVEFSTADDGSVCEECAGMDGDVYAIEEAHGIIPVHPNCRCAFRPSLPSSLTGNRYRSAARNYARPKWYTWPVQNRFCPTGPGGGVDPTCKVTLTWRDQLHHLKDEIVAEFRSLPKPVQEYAEAAWHTAFIGWSVAQNFAERVAKERGLSDQEARALRGKMALDDLMMFKPASLGAAMVGHHATLATWVVPPSTGVYLLSSAALHPIKTIKAAYKLVRDAVRDPYSVLTTQNAEHLDDWWLALYAAARGSGLGAEEGHILADKLFMTRNMNPHHAKDGKFTTADAGDSAFSAHYGDWLASHEGTDAGYAASNYGHHWDEVINGRLRGTTHSTAKEYLESKGIKDVDVKAEKYTKLLDQLIESAPRTPGNLTVYRGVHHELAEQLLSKNAGDMFQDSGFTSASYEPSIAKSFAQTIRWKDGPKSLAQAKPEDFEKVPGVVLKIHVPKGAEVAPIGMFTGGGEGEVLLPRGSTFRVESKRGRELTVSLQYSIANAFCPTGPGGGVDPTCSPSKAMVPVAAAARHHLKSLMDDSGAHPYESIAYKTTVDNMPAKPAQCIADNLDSIGVFPKAEMADACNKLLGTREIRPGIQVPLGLYYPPAKGLVAEHEPQDTKGSFHSVAEQLVGTLQHEMGHALDHGCRAEVAEVMKAAGTDIEALTAAGTKYGSYKWGELAERYSDIQRWRDVWSDEHDHVSRYAGTNPIEGFAEFHRAVCHLRDSGRGYQELKDRCPGMYKFWEDYGLL